MSSAVGSGTRCWNSRGSADGTGFRRTLPGPPASPTLSTTVRACTPMAATTVTSRGSGGRAILLHTAVTVAVPIAESSDACWHCHRYPWDVTFASASAAATTRAARRQ